jgi:hypothetical protein
LYLYLDWRRVRSFGRFGFRLRARAGQNAVERILRCGRCRYCDGEDRDDR